ncbi:ABC transporter ATP-binding protein [soil metagenome]
MTTYARLLEIAPRARMMVAGLVALLLATTATYVGQGLLVARALGRVFAGQPATAIVALLAGVVALQVVRCLLIFARETLALRASGVVKAAVRQRLVAQLLALGPGWLQRTRTGTVQSTLVDGVETLDPYVGRFLPQVVAAVLGATAVTVFLAVLDPLVGVIVLVCAVITPIMPGLSRRLMDDRNKAWFTAYRELYAENLDAVQGMATLKAFNASRRRGEDLHARAVAFCRDSVRLVGVVVIYVGVVEFMIGVGTAAAVGIGALRLANGELAVVELLIILLLTREAFRPLRDLETAYHASYSARPACTGIFELLDAEPDVTDPPAAAEPAETVAELARTEPPGLSFADVTFAYRERKAPALDAFTLDVAPGERVALVGRSGAGKTTVVSLLLRFFDGYSGRIAVAGRDVRTLPVTELRALGAVVAQDTYLFHGSVQRNLQLARADAGDDELEAAARAARAHDFITALPQGYDTVVGERGLKLSGGQRQRGAIARALLKDAPILVLDEATSSIDAANEASIQHALDELTQGRTTLVIAHRLSTVRSADRVVVLDEGRVVEIGAHDALLAGRGAYADLVAAQQVRR